MYKIEKGIPLPTHISSIYPFKEMEIGDSFFVENADEKKCRGIKEAAKQKGIIVICHEEAGGVRVFRVDHDQHLNRRRKEAKPYMKLNAGDTIFIPSELNGSLQTCAGAYGRRRGWTITTRYLVENGVPGYRIWRTA